MKKTILAALAAAALGATGLAQASDAECQAGITCTNGIPNTHIQAEREQQMRQYGYGYGYGNAPWVLGNSGILQGVPYGAIAGIPGITQYGYQTPYARTQRDRDGDGVRNSLDRYPDDPRYR